MELIYTRCLGESSILLPYFALRPKLELLKSISTGAATKFLTLAILKDVGLEVPPQSVQHKIAAILSAYDDLIENNTRRIQILEEMARAIYREWFVNFRFPGHEDVKMVDSELGPIPEGWEVRTISDFGQIHTGKTPSKKIAEYFGGTIPFIKPPDMHGRMFCIETGDTLSEQGALSQENKTLPPDSLCVSCIGTPGLVVITHSRCQTNQQINSIVLNNIEDREYLYFALVSLKPTIERYAATGATMPNLSKGKFESLRLLYPGAENVSLFHNLLAPMFGQISNLQLRCINLRQARDFLLPKLISGEINVENLSIATMEEC
ncbi:MAG TPA: restriction endonuclease subunit S [Pyrinomonadaceae bacterium]|jgi:type I restriction enzyme S subunit